MSFVYNFFIHEFFIHVSLYSCMIFYFHNYFVAKAYNAQKFCCDKFRKKNLLHARSEIIISLKA